jgi:hypothetical protein
MNQPGSKADADAATAQSAAAKVIIRCNPNALDQAFAIATSESKRLSEYRRIGWGWHMGRYPDAWFFVRAIKGGISVTQTFPDGAPSASTTDDSRDLGMNPNTTEPTDDA